MINLDEENLLRQYAQTKDTEIERLLDQYGSSLKEVREMYPQLTTAIEKRQQTSLFPTQDLFFSASEAQDMGLGLQEGCMLKMSPAEGGYTSSLITPQKWEITENDMYISPTGEQYSKVDLQALLSAPTGGLMPEDVGQQPLTMGNLTEEGQRLYGEYQQAGGALDAGAWYQEREQTQLETEEVFGKVFPEQDVDEVLNYMSTNPEGFLADIREIGPTEDMIALLKTLEFQDEDGTVSHLTDEEIQGLFGTEAVPQYIPESKVKDTWDAFIAGGMSFIQGIETYLFTNPPAKPTPETANILVNAWATHTTPIAPEFTGEYAMQKYEQGLQSTVEGYLRRRDEQQEFWISHPELAPNPKYLVNPFENPSLLKDPGYWGYSIANSLVYSLAVMGTMMIPGIGIPAGFALAGMPEAGQMIDELVDRGVPLEQATGPAQWYGMAAGAIEGASDLPFLGLIFKPFKTAMQPFWTTVTKGFASGIVKAGITGVLITQGEALEEVLTQVIHNAIVKHYDETQSIMEGVSQAYIQATIASLPFGGIGGYASYQTFRANLSTDVGKQLDGLVTNLQAQGLTEEQAQIQAVNELVRQPELEQDLSKAIEAAQTEYLESQGVKSVEELIRKPELSDKILNEMKIAEGIKTAPKVVTPTEVKGVKEPWQMTKAEWETARENLRPDTRQVNFTRKSGSEEVARFRSIDRLNYGVEKPIDVELMGRPAVKHSDVITKALSEGKPVPAEVLKDYPDLARGVPKGEAGMPEGIVIDEETYLAQHGASRQDIGDSALHKNIGTGRAKEQAIKRQQQLDTELLAKREVLRKEYQAKVASGEIRPPTRIEKLIATAQGNTDNESVMAARRLLEKKGIDWKQPNRPAEPLPQGMRNPAGIPEHRLDVGSPTELGIIPGERFVDDFGMEWWMAKAGERTTNKFKLDTVVQGQHISIWGRKMAGWQDARAKALAGLEAMEKVPETPPGMPEAGLQAGIPGMAAAEVVRPQPTGKLVQARIDDYLRLRDYNSKVTQGRIDEINKALEKKGRSELGLKGNLVLEQARLEALKELESVENIADLDSLIKQVESELANRELPYHGGARNLFKGYTTRQLEEMRNVYLQARERMLPEVAAVTVKAQDIPMDVPALKATSLTSTQVQKTIDLFKEAVVAPGSDAQRAAAIELRKHVFAQRAKSASESAQAMIAEGMNPEEAIKAAEQMFMTGKLPDVTTDYFDDLTQEMRNVLFAKVYNYWHDKSWTELISTFEALTNALAGRSIPRVKGIGTKYFPDGGSAWDRLARVFVGDEELLQALDQQLSLPKIIEGIYLQSGRGEVTLDQATVDWLKELATISEEDKILLTKPLSELTEADVKRIAESWFWQRKAELDTQLREGVINEQEYKLELALAKDRVFPYRTVAPGITFPTGPVGQARLGEKYIQPAAIEETRTERELRLKREAMEAEARLAEARAKRLKEPFQPVVFDAALNDELSKQLPLLTLREKETIIRTLKTLGLGAVDIGNFVRANKASCDMSAWRQVMTLTPGNPVAAYRSEVEAWKSLFSQASAEANWEWVKRQPSFPYYAEMVEQTGQDFLRVFKVPKGTSQWQASEEFGYLTAERAIPRFTAKVPWIKWSGRAFTTKVNTFTIMIYNKRLEATLARADMIATGKIKLPEGEGFSIQAEMNDYGKAIAWMTQRASLGKAKALAPEISATVFAPRSWLGRFLTPKLLIDSNPRVRAFAWKNLSLDVAVIGGLVTLGYFLGLWDYEDDPRSGEFGSIRIGNLRIDPWAGSRQFLVLYTRLITGTGVYSATGQEYEVNPIGALTSFFRNALSPLASRILDFWTGKNFQGEKVDIANLNQWIDGIAPFTVQTVWEAYQDSWQHGVIAFLPAFFGAGVSTYSGDWGQNWLKVGLPKYPENTGHGIYEPVYDLADFWADTASQFKGVDPATLTESKGFPEYVRSIVHALQIIDQIELLPNKKLTSINANPEDGTTFMQYYQMWQERQKIVASGDKEALKGFDADERTRNAYLGNMSQSQYALLVEYHSLPESEKAEFLGKHPELYANPKEEWLRTHPDENALLALWLDPETHGIEADIYSPEALSKMESLAKSLGIPESAMFGRDIDEVTKLKLKNQKLFDLVEAYGGLDDTIKDADGLTAKDRALQGLYAENPDFRDDTRRIEALEVGTVTNPTPSEMVEGWVERGQIVDDFGANSAEAKLWLIDNREVHRWALDNALVSDTGEDWNENILRLQVNYGEDFDKYDALESPEAREAMLFSKDKMTSFGVAYYTINALQKNLPENLVTTYVDYYGIRKREGIDYSAGWYEDDWFKLEHKDFYDEMVRLGLWQSQDFSKVPTRQVYGLYKTYMGLPTGAPRLDFRAENKALDDWLVLSKGYTPVGNR